MAHHYLMHIPHSGTDIPDTYLDSYLLPREELQETVYQYCDLYTDALFDPFLRQFGGVKSHYSRLLFDPERFGDDRLETMHTKYGLGWFYENAILSKKPLRDTTHKEAIRPLFEAHHAELNHKTAEKLDRYGQCTIIDCHSFSDTPYWFMEQEVTFPDICIGFEKRHVDEQVVAYIKEVFEGYNIGINTPYSGALVPTAYWGKDERVKSVMIEINKRLYLESDNITKSVDYPEIEKRLATLLSKLLERE